MTDREGSDFSVRKKVLWLVVIFIIFSSLLFSGCATTIPLAKRDLTTLTPLRVATCVVPYEGVYARHSGGETTSTAVTVVISAASPLIGVIGGMIADIPVRAWEKALAEEIISAKVPRYYELVMKKFVERSSEEIPGWPPMVVEEQPVNSQYAKNFLKSKSGSLLLLVPAHYLPPTLSTAHGFESTYYAVIYDSEAHLVWKKGFEYSSKKFDRYRSIDEYKTDNFKPLKEEMEFAAETTVSDFIQTILKEISPPEVSAQTEREQRDLTTEKSSQEQTQQKEAPKDSGMINITSDPPGAKIFIDGEFKGQTPVEISLNTGMYQIFLQRQLYEPYKDSVMIEKGQTKTFNIRLTPEGGAQK
jgi:hypothetical protein